MKCPACAEEVEAGAAKCPHCSTFIATGPAVAHANMPPAGALFIGAALVLAMLSVLGMSQVNGGAVLGGLACLCGIFARIIQAGAQHKAEMKRPR